MMLQRPDKAEPEIRKAVQLDPKNGPALLSLALLQINGGKRMDEAEWTLKRLSALPGKTYKDLHAIFLYETGRKDSGISELEMLVRDDPGNRLMRGRLVVMYRGANRAQDAEKLMAGALKRNPRDTDALLQRSQLYLKEGRPRQAEQDLTEVLHFQSDSAQAHFALARVYAVEGLGNRRRHELDEALRLDKNLLPARLALAKNFVLANQPQAALDLLDDAPESQKRNLAVIAARNWALLQAGNTKELRASLNQALRIARTPELVLQDGLLRMKEKDYAGSRTDAEEVLRLKPEDSRGARLLADTYLALNEAPKATHRLAELAALHPKSASMQSLLGQWYMKNGQLVEARKALDAALAGDPGLVAAAINLAEIDVREHQLDAARQRLQAALAKQPRNVAALLLLAGINAEAGDRPGEIAAYRSVIATDGSNVFALNNLAYALAPDNPEEALELAKRAVELGPGNPAAQDTLGWIYYRKQMYDAAITHLKAAVDRDPNPRRQFHLAMSYAKSGHPESGRELLRNALRQDPSLATTEQGW
jgi:predicted Zn-dependent protease